MDYGDYINGFVQRESHGEYRGQLSVEGIDLSPIEAQYFKKDGSTYLFIKRKPIMVYDTETCSYRNRERKPNVEIYMKKQIDGDTVAFKGDFMFMRFKFNIVGVWDKILGKDNHRLNLYVERLPMSEQTLLRSINERKKAKK